MNINANGDKEPPNEGKSIKDGVFGERESSFAVSQLNVLAAANGVERDGAILGLQGPSTLLVQPPSQGSVVCWERFLNVESIRVLLVENDDSTRHVVAALLRNCHYEVVMAANGLQAWKVLEDLNNRIDIVLTEVVMPFLPGIPLLSKIMSHKTRKNVPVIMMSSHDSMGLVFKCLSKGAVDFLVKPIRKNELKNLWQHVWRRCHSSSGSGSESGTQTQKSVKSKSCEKSGNSRSGDGENDLDGLNVGDGSDDGSGTQSSWTKQAVEVDSSPAMSPMDQVAECPDSTCAQVIRSHAENSVHDQKSDNDAEDRDLETFMPRNMEPKIKNQIESPVTVISSKLKSLSEFNCSSILNQGDMGQSNPTVDCQFSKNKGGSDEASNPFFDGRESDSTREVVNKLDNNRGPNVELSLKRLRQVEDTGRSSQDDRYVLHRSEQSAFSRYNTSSNVFKAPNGITRSSSMIENNAEVLKQESTRATQAQSSPNETSNMLDMGSTTNKHSIHPSSMKEKTGDTTTINGLHHSAFRPVKNDLRYNQQYLGSVQQERQIHPSHQNHGCFRNSKKETSSNQDESSLQKLTADENGMNCGLDRSGSGSNHVSNGQNGSSIVINAAGTNGESDVGQAGKSGSGGDASGSGCGDRVDEDKVARRLAALSKFRQKKKDRCFTKKVRYHNRKKLAEQRPRVRGQFVKQMGTDTSNKTSDE